jgi:hypothetical protein
MKLLLQRRQRIVPSGKRCPCTSRIGMTPQLDNRIQVELSSGVKPTLTFSAATKSFPGLQDQVLVLYDLVQSLLIPFDYFLVFENRLLVL